VAPASSVTPGERLPAGWFLAGSATTSLVPPADRVKSAAECKKSGQQSQLYTPATPEGCLITFDGLWMDGVDEANPISARSIAISNGKDTVVFTLMDVVGYMAAYPPTSAATAASTRSPRACPASSASPPPTWSSPPATRTRRRRRSPRAPPGTTSWSATG
jgi:hypothetical protein